MAIDRRAFLGSGFLAATAGLQGKEASLLPRGFGPLKITDAKAVSADGYIYYKVFTDGGIIGIGEPSPSGGAINADYLHKTLKPLLIGMNVFEIEKIWEKLYLGTYKIRGQGVSMAISGVDIALHDIVGKALGVPVYQLLGGLYRDRIRMYASFTNRERPAKEQAVLCARMVEQGYSATKIKIAARHGFDSRPLEVDKELVREVRSAIGGKIDLMVDANSGYSVARAIQMGRYLESQNVFWFEEPVPFTDIEGTAKVAAALDIPIAGGEQDHTRYDFHKLIAAGALDIIQADVTKAGGLSECKKIAAMADAAGLFYSPHDTSWNIGLAACLHLVASTPCCRYAQEFITEPREGRAPFLKEPFQPDRGYLAVPQKPGLGIEVADRYWNA
ncbi:MAG: mandelate racemase/muconate lactonizing enzyme family protein [Bryobacteraceae bacterium]|jgi:L-alanine-DL-glutamate epimerase-like enolase superfamily enzyme